MAKVLQTAEDARRASQEILDILETMRNVKGEPYAGAVRGLFAMSNFMEAVGSMHQFLPEEDWKIAYIKMMNAHSISVRDLARTLINSVASTQKEGESREEYESRWEKVKDEINKDVLMLYSKQNEYSATFFGLQTPKNREKDDEEDKEEGEEE